MLPIAHKLYKVAQSGKIMFIDLDGSNLTFFQVDLNFKVVKITDVFSKKNNKTLRETLKHNRYRKLKDFFYQNYQEKLDFLLGDVLSTFKEEGNLDYKLFLNKYGDLTYSTFSIDCQEVLHKKGLYLYRLKDEIKYIGRCLDAFDKRINLGYGKIHPKNCYLDGQATNCHLNSLITKNRGNISLWICPLKEEKRIIELEDLLLKNFSPEWNIRRNNKKGGKRKMDMISPINNKEKVYDFLSKNMNSGYCDDCLVYLLEIHPRQQINQICRGLEYQKKVERIKASCTNCRKMKISNFYAEK